MSTTANDLRSSLRQDFDDGFTRSIATRENSSHDLLAIRVAGAAFALRVAEVAGIFTDSKLVSFPSNVQAFSGLVGFRGTVVPIYDLAVLLHAAHLEPRRWLVLSNAANIGFAFDTFEGHLRIARSDIVASDDTQQKHRSYAREIANVSSGARPIINLGDVIEQITALATARANAE
jgi:purine-binding chemotaxis protein CheW